MVRPYRPRLDSEIDKQLLADFKDPLTDNTVESLKKRFPPLKIEPGMTVDKIFYEAGIAAVITLLERTAKLKATKEN